MAKKSTQKSGFQKGGQKGWASEEQSSWLCRQLSNYLSLRGKGTRLNAFWEKLYESWFEHWPEKSTDGCGSKKMVCLVIQSQLELIDCPIQQLKQWFNNRTCSMAIPEVQKKLLNLIK